MGRLRSPEEFVRKAVELYRPSGRPGVARSHGIADGSVAAWVKEFDARDNGGLDKNQRVELRKESR